MQSEAAISRELMGKIVDEVFDGAIEDASVIEEIYAVIKREEANLSKIEERKPLDLNITQDWFEKRSALEADHEIGAGSRKLTACIDPTPDELAELFKIAHRIPDGWQLVPIAALSAAEPVAAMTTDYLGCEYVSMDVAGIEKIAAAHSKGPTEVVYLYAAPPAPPVAVKADLPERFEEWWAGRDSKGEKTLDYNQRKQLAWDAFYAAALSAQVQDVAGAVEAFERDYPELYWHIAKGKVTAGEPLYGAIIADLRGNELGHGESDVSAVDAFNIAVSAALPAAPAKQEGGESKPVHNQSVENGESGDK